MPCKDPGPDYVEPIDPGYSERIARIEKQEEAARAALPGKYNKLVDEYNELSEKFNVLQKNHLYYKKVANNVTRLLCELCTKLAKSKSARLISANKPLKLWWEKHQKADAKRED